MFTQYKILFFFVFIFINVSRAQEIKINPGETQTNFYSEITAEKTVYPQRKISSEEQMLNEKLLEAKHTGNADKMERIQKQIDKYAGSVTGQGIITGKAELLSGSVPSEQVITATKISGSQGVRALAAVREQIGSTDRMWVVYSVSQFTSTDTIFTIYSDDDGNNWNYFSKANITNTSFIQDQIDIELVQTTTEKYLYIVAGIRINPTGKFLIGMIVNRIGSNPGISLTYLQWPGENNSNTNVKKYRPRLTSDCATYQFNGAWIYIACCQDSLVSTGWRTCVKVARINNPYAIIPLLTMKGTPYYFNDEMQYPDSYVDLAYYRRNNLHQIAVLQSNVPLNSNLYLTGSEINSFTSTAEYLGYMNGGQAREKKFGRISSNGNYPNLMITALETYSPDDLDVQYFKTTNSGQNWTNGYIDYSGLKSWRADIIERKNVPGEFYAAYPDDVNSSFYKVNYCKSVSGNWGAVSYQMNHLYSSIYITSPCYTSAATDNCFAIWSEVNGTNIWGSAGCSGSIVMNRNLQLNLFIQGRYNPDSDLMAGDTLQVLLRNTFTPYAIVASVKAFQGSNGLGSYNFPAAVNGTNYYIVVKHRNSIETWSRSPGQAFNNGVLNYNFYTWAQAYGGNLVEVDIVPYRFGIYTGDINQDGIIDIADGSLINNDALNFASGYLTTDVNGDGIVDVADAMFADNNGFNFVGKITP